LQRQATDSSPAFLTIGRYNDASASLDGCSTMMLSAVSGRPAAETRGGGEWEATVTDARRPLTTGVRVDRLFGSSLGSDNLVYRGERRDVDRYQSTS